MGRKTPTLRLLLSHRRDPTCTGTVEWPSPFGSCSRGGSASFNSGCRSNSVEPGALQGASLWLNPLLPSVSFCCNWWFKGHISM